jgi:hypothetical protein
MGLGILNFIFMSSRWARKKERGLGDDFRWFDAINRTALLTGLLEDLSLLLLTVIASADDRPWHEKGFVFFILFAHLHFVFFLWAFWLSRVPFTESEQNLFKRLMYIALAHAGTFALAILVYFRHKTYCEPGSTFFSIFSLIIDRLNREIAVDFFEKPEAFHVRKLTQTDLFCLNSV